MNMRVSIVEPIVGGLDRYHCYGEGLRQLGLTAIPLEVELWYPETEITEWQYSFIRMLLLTAGCVRPVRRLEFSALTRRFRLSERQIRRHLEAMVRNGLLLIHKCYDQYGRRETYLDFDCSPFLQKIAALAGSAQFRQCILAPQVARPTTYGADRSDKVVDASIDTVDYAVTSVTDRSDNVDRPMTDLSAPAVVLSSMTDVSTAADASFFSASNSSNSKYNNNYNNNYIISNSKHAHADTFDTAVCTVANAEQVACSAVVSPTLPSTSQPAPIPQPSEHLAAPADEHAVASKLYVLPAPAAEPERTLAEPPQVEEPVAKIKPERAPIQALLAASWQASEAPLEMNTRVALRRVSRELGDDASRSSQTRAHKLYRHLLQLNQLDDEYTLDNPDLYFAELLLDIRERLRGVKFRYRNAQGQPNGIPLFFTELEREILQLVDRVRALREQDPAEPPIPSSYQSQQEKFWGRSQEPEEIELSMTEQHCIAAQIGTYSFTNQQLADEMCRLGQPLDALEEQDLLDGLLPDDLREQIATAVRQGLYYEEIDRQQAMRKQS